MTTDQDLYLEDCTAFARALARRPPTATHGTLLVLAGLLAAATLWAAVTEADLVVVARGRVRPCVRETTGLEYADEEIEIAAEHGGCVAQIHYREGDQVEQGDVLVCLDARRLENDLARAERAAQAGRQELAQLEELLRLQKLQFAAARAQAVAELEKAQNQWQTDQAEWQSASQLAQLELELSQDTFHRARQLAASQAVSEAKQVEAAKRLQEAEVRLARAALLPNDAAVKVSQLALDVVERDFEIEVQQSRMRRESKRAEVDAVMLEIANLQLQLEQTTLVAPAAGLITSLNCRVGKLLEAGEVAVELAQVDAFQLEIEVPNHEIGHLQVGLPARVRLDAFDSQRFGSLEGHLTYVSPDSQTIDGIQGHPTHYLAHITLDQATLTDGNLSGRVKLGMTGQADIITGQESILSLLWHGFRRTISLP